MAGHTITPYELVATRKYARGEPVPLLLSAGMAKEGTADLLDVLEKHLLDVEPVETKDGSRSVSCVLVNRRGDMLDMVFACDVTGERELVMEPTERVVVFTRGPEHVARYYSCCSVWRPSDGERGLMLLHSPWGRGGSKGQIAVLLQRAMNEESDNAAKLSINPKIPHKVLESMLRNAKATKITYTKQKGIRSKFTAVTGRKSAPAEMALVVRGSETGVYRDALTAAMKASQNREKFFTVEVRDPETGGYKQETFEDVEVAIETSAGIKTYSMRDDSIPTMGFDFTTQLNKVYLALPGDDHAVWPERLSRGARTLMDSVQQQVEAGS